MVPHGTIWYHMVPYGTIMVPFWYHTDQSFPFFHFSKKTVFPKFKKFPFFHFSIFHFSKIPKFSFFPFFNFPFFPNSFFFYFFIIFQVFPCFFLKFSSGAAGSLVLMKCCHIFSKSFTPQN